MSIDRLARKLPQRYWDQLQRSWITNLPVIDPPGARPTPLTDNEDLVYWCEQFMVERRDSPPGEIKTLTGSIAGLRQSIFHEGVYWLHKAIHAMSGAESKVVGGTLTWSVIDSYLSAFFSMRSIVASLGVAICDFKGKSYVIDLCRGFGNMRSQKREIESAFADQVSIHTFGVRFDHKQCWYILQRLLNVLRNEPWDNAISKAIYELETTDFAHHRNRISYYVESWLRDDMHDPKPDDTFASAVIVKPNHVFDTEDSAFTIRLSYVLITLALTLYAQVASVGTILSQETQVLSRSLDILRHPYFGDSLHSLMTN